MSKLIVQKYGGSSLSDNTRIMSVAERISQNSILGYQTVVVVSAMGKSTDDLLSLSVKISDNPSKRELDFLLSTGEMISCALVTMALNSLGHQAISLTGAQAGISTDSEHSQARILGIDTNRILKEIEEQKVVVIAGFQGMAENSDITTLGRGGSDTTAVALAASLEADMCEIYTDVDGIYTADPRVVPDARILKEIGYEEMMEMASHGAKMHPRSIELAALYHVPIRVTSSFKNVEGTLIH
jgi:aspartate kinase